jgi:TRAP-type C4-dicarboxylate transport system substrate-binding protein
MSYGDMYEAIKSGAIDGAELSATAAFNTRMYEVTKYLSETRHILLINFEVISSKWFGMLPREYQKILEEECDRAGLEVSRRYLDTLDVESMQKLRARGMTIVPASGIDLAAFRSAGEAAYRKLALDAVRDRIYEGLGKK